MRKNGGPVPCVIPRDALYGLVTYVDVDEYDGEAWLVWQSKRFRVSQRERIPYWPDWPMDPLPHEVECAVYAVTGEFP